MPHVTTKDGTDLYVKDWGSGRPVVLIHGWPLDADSWDPVSYALAGNGYRVIAYDRRGFGRSGQPWTGYDYDTMSDDLADVMEAAGVSDAALVGFSMAGGEIARYMSRHGGAGVSQAVLVSSIAPGMLKSDANPHGITMDTVEQMRAGLLEDRAKFLKDFFPSFYGTGLISHPVSQEVIDWSWNMAMMASLKATVDCVDAFATTDLTPDLSAFTVPTLVIHGTGDKTVPIEATGHRAAKGIAGATLIEYDGAPHGIPATHTDRLVQDLVSFLHG